MKQYDTSGKGEHEYEHHAKHEILKSLDQLTTDPKNKLKKPVVSYFGVNKELGQQLHDKAKESFGFQFSSPAYISSSHDHDIAHTFAEKNNKGQRHIMVFHLPAGFQNSKAIPNAREGGKSRTDERLFARNQPFKHIKTVKKGLVFYHHFKPI